MEAACPDFDETILSMIGILNAIIFNSLVLRIDSTNNLTARPVV